MSAHKNRLRLEQAYALHRQGQLAEAAGLYRQIVKDEANNFHALHFLGLIEAAEGRLEQAEKLMARSLAIRPPNVQFVENYATLLFKAAQFDKAAEICRRGIGLDGKNLNLLRMLGLSQLKLGRPQDALAQFDAILALQRSNIAALNGRSVALSAMKQYDAAMAAVERALAIDPNSVDANINKGNLFSVQDRFEDALACYDRALALQPSNPDALGGKAIALVPLGRIDDARVAIEKALAMAPREVRFYSTLAQFRKFTHDDPHLNAMRQLARDWRIWASTMRSTSISHSRRR